MWLKQTPDFESTECLNNFLKDTKGILAMYDAPIRQNY